MKAYACAAFGAVALGFVTIAPAVSLQVSIGIRETGTEAPIGGDGGTSGGMEWINLDGQVLNLDGTFQTFTFNFGTDTVTPFAGATANGMLDGTRGTLEHIRFRSLGGTTEPIQLFIDNVRNTTPQGTFTVSDFEPFPAGSRVTFQPPRFSGTTQPFLQPDYNVAHTSEATASQGLRSDEIVFAFSTIATGAWLRLTTFRTLNAPNPAIDFAPGSTLSFDIRGGLVPEPAGAAAFALALAGLPWRRRRRCAARGLSHRRR